MEDLREHESATSYHDEERAACEANHLSCTLQREQLSQLSADSSAPR